MRLLGGEYFTAESKTFLMGESDNYESLSLISMQASYIDLIDWTDTIVSEPAFTASVTSSEIKEMIKSKTFSEFKIPELPCHTQSVECRIKLASEASSLVCGHASREGLIRNKLSSRATMPSFNTMSQYKTLK